MVRKICEVERSFNKKRRPAGSPFFVVRRGKVRRGKVWTKTLRTSDSFPPDLFYQILIRSSGFLYNLSPGFTPNAVYQASIFTGAPIVRYWLGE